MHHAPGLAGPDLILPDRRHDRPVLLLAFGLAAVLHIAIFLVLDRDVPPAPNITYFVFDTPAEPPPPDLPVFDDEVIEALPPADPGVEQMSAPLTLPAAPLRPMVPGNETGATPDAGIGALPGIGDDPGPVRDRLRYRLGTTPQVWRAPSEEFAPVEPTPQERVHQRIASQLDQFNDSVAAEARARERATDWTVTDSDGRRWGVSPGVIHLGSISIPLAPQLAAAPGRREEFTGRVRTWNEIQGQASRIEADESFKERVRAIEERKAKERSERGDAPAAPATTTPPATGSGSNNSSGGGNSGNNVTGGSR